MAGLGALWDPNLHPRGFHGRFIKKFKLAPWLDKVLKDFSPRQFQTDSQAAQFNFNAGHDSPGGAFTELDMRRIHTDFDEAADHMRHGDIDPTTKKFMDTMDRHMAPTKEGLILGRTFGPEALGLTPQQLNESDPNGIVRMMGNTITDRAYSPTHLGSDLQHGAGKITMRIAVPPGVRVAHSGQSRGDRGVFLDKGQRLLVTRVYPDQQGGWYMTAVAEPVDAEKAPRIPGIMQPLVQGRKGANLTPAQREANIGGPTGMQVPAEPPSAPARQVNIAGKESTLPGPPQEQTPARKAAKAARQAGYQQAVANEAQQAGAPAPQAVTPTPAPAPPGGPGGAPGVGERTEPVHGPIGGVPTGGKSASEIGATPAEAPTPAPAAPAPASAQTFKQAFQDAGLQSPTAGPQRKEFNDAYLGVTGGKKDPADALRELDADIEKNKHLLSQPEGKTPHEELRANVAKQEKLAGLIADHFQAPRGHKEAGPPTAPEAPAPTKKPFTSVKELTPAERAHYDTLNQSGRSKYLARRRAGQEHGTAFEGAKGVKATPTPAKAAPTTTKRADQGMTAEGKLRASQLQSGDKILANKGADGSLKPATRKTGASVVTVKHRDANGDVVGTDENGNEVRITGTGHGGKLASHQTFFEHKEKAPRATKAAKAVPEKAPEAAKAAPAKVAKATRAGPGGHTRPVSEVQTRANEAGLPATVTALRQAAREKKIRGFSTMNKEQLQRALLGEEVGTGGKLGAIAPDKLTPHLEAASSGQAARALLDEHTVADMKALAKHNGIPLKGLTTKDKLKDAVLTHVRGVEGSGIAPGKPEKSLKEEIQGIKIPDEADRIVAGVNQDDPASLRSARDQLDELAKTAEPVDAGRIRKLSDAMGMRAQVISGTEEPPPTAKKAAKAVKKAAAPKLSVHQERVRKQALADGASAEEARAAGEAAPTRAPAGTKALSKKAAAAKKAAGLPESRAEGAPGPKLTAPRKAVPEGVRPAREGLVPGGAPGQLGPGIGPREPTPTERFLATPPKERVHPGTPNFAGPPVGSPERERMLKALSEGRLGSGQVLQGPDVREVTRLRAQEIAPKSVLARPEKMTPDQIKAALDKATTMEEGRAALQGLTVAELKKIDPDAGRTTTRKADLVDAIVSKGKNQRTVGQMAKGMFSEPVAKEAVAKAEKAHPEAPAPVVKATRAKVAKAVPDGSVGTRGSEPIANSERHNEFQQGWNKAMNKVSVPDKTSQGSLNEIHKDVASGKITPEEGIRRLETDISLNQDEIDDINRTLRSGNVPEGPEMTKLMEQRDRLITSKAGQETASKFMHQHFGKERVTAPEVTEQIKETQGQSWWDSLNKTDPEEFRRVMKEESGLDLKGSNAQEMFQDAVRQTIKGELDKRAAAKEARNAQKATREAARAKAVEEFSPGGAKHLDAKAIAGDLEIDQRHIDMAQADLNQGMSPAKAAERIRQGSSRLRDSNAIRHGALDKNRASPEAQVEQADRFRKGKEEADRLDAFAEKVAAAKRPRLSRAPAKTAAESITEARKATKEPAVRKELAKAETAVKEAGDEAAKLKQRVLDRHQKAWDGATTRQEAEAAATNMRQDLLLSEIRDWAKPQGITGRSKDDILKKAIERRFNTEALPPGPTRVQAVNDRMQRAASLRGVAEALSDVDQMHANQGSERAIRSTIQGHQKRGDLSPDVANRLEKAAVAKDTGELDAIAKEHGLTRNTGGVEAVEPFDPTRHQAGEPGIRKGQLVSIVRPGYQGVSDGRTFQAKRADVVKAPAQKGEISAVPAETRAAVIQRLTRAPGPSAPVKRGSPAKVAVAELPTNKQEEVAQNLARLKAAKTVPVTEKFSPDTTAADLAKATTIDEGRQILARAQTKADLQKLADKVGFEHKPHHTKAQLQEGLLRRTVTTRLEHGAYVRLGDAAPSETTKKPPIPSDLNKLKPTELRALAEAHGIKTRTDDGKLKTAASLRTSLGSSRTVQDIRTLAKGGHNEPLISTEATPVRERSAPVRRAHVQFNEGTSAATFNRGGDLRAPNGSWSSDQGLIHMDSQIGQLWQDLAKDDRVSTPDLNKITVIGQQLAKGDINLNQAGTRLNEIRNGLPDGAVKNRFTETVRDISGPKKPDVSVPDNTPKEVRDWLEKVADTPTFNKARPGKDKTAFEELQDTVREVSEGKRPQGAESRLATIGNMHESTDGYYALRRDAGKVFSTPEARKWFMTRPSAGQPEASPASVKVGDVVDGKKVAQVERISDSQGHRETRLRDTGGNVIKTTPAKAVKKAAKAAPKVTQAELRSPVPKAGAEAPAAPAKAVKATGLAPGDGIPVGNRLALENKLGQNKKDLNALDRAVRSDRAKVPELLARVNVQLGQAGIGPNDEPRKSLNQWYQQHFS